jgi:hypothetical protein
MKYRYIILIVCFTFMFPFSTNGKSDNCIIQLTNRQLEIVGKTRILKLNKKQALLINNKIIVFRVGGPSYFAPEGWFYANWIGPRIVSIRKELIENFDLLVKESKRIQIISKNFFVLNFNIRGELFYNNNKVTLKKVFAKITNFIKKNKNNEINIYISYAPIEDKISKNLMLKKANIIKKFAKKNKIYIQDDW